MRVQANARKSSRPVRRDLFKKHLLIDEVAYLFGVHVNSVKAWIKGDEPKLPSVKFQGRRYITKADALKLAAELGVEIRF